MDHWLDGQPITLWEKADLPVAARFHCFIIYIPLGYTRWKALVYKVVTHVFVSLSSKYTNFLNQENHLNYFDI